ncbi:MAG: penicillin-binding protein activator [Pseudomonadota bacterium]
MAAPIAASRMIRRALFAGLAVLAAGCASKPPPTTQPGSQASPAVPEPTQRPAQAGPARVALLVPLGTSDERAAATARAIRNAAELAVSGPVGRSVSVTSYDTSGTPQGAAAAAEKALAAGAEIVLGPLFAASTTAVAAVTRQAGVPVLSFSTDTSVAGGGVWVTGFAPEAEVERILAFAAGQGIGSVAVYAPAVPYGDAALRGLDGAASAAGVTVTAVESYPRSFQDIENTSPGFARRALDSGAEAVLMPDFSQGLAIAASFLAFHGLPQPQFRYLGTGQWESGETLRAPELEGGWFAGADRTATEAFFNRYSTRYGQRPPFFAVLGYDAARIAAVVAADGSASGGARFSAQSLTRSGGFEGAVGAVRLRPDGRTDRGLAVLQVSRGRFEVLDPAPRRFDIGS